MYEELINRVMDLLLSGESNILHILKKQFQNCNIKKIEETGSGVYVDFEIKDQSLRLEFDDTKGSFAFGDVYGTVDNFFGAVGFVLFVKNGYITTLEGYSNIPSSWCKVSADIPLGYDEEKRNIAELEKTWRI